MCGILALINLGAIVDCLLGDTGKSDGVRGRYAGGGSCSHDVPLKYAAAENMPDEVCKLITVRAVPRGGPLRVHLCMGVHVDVH